MTRKEEIEILIAHLKNEVSRIATKNSTLLVMYIVDNGKLIEKYQEELKLLK